MNTTAAPWASPAFLAATVDLLVPFLVEHEGERLVSYRDIAGVWTIGVGHTGSDVRPGLTITQARSRELLRDDISFVLSRLVPAIRRPVTVGQMAALASLAFNVGITNTLTSTALRRVKAGDMARVPAAIRMWRKATVKGRRVISPGLVNRREAEINELWNHS